MPAPDSFLEETLRAWRDVREGIAAGLALFPEERLDFRPAPGFRDVRALVQHILEVSMMMTGELTRADTDLHRAPWPELLALYAGRAWEADTKRALLDLLADQLDEAEGAFRERGEEALWEPLVNFDGSRGSKMQWLQHGIAQEMYHRGQLALIARLSGLEPALTRRIRGAEG